MRIVGSGAGGGVVIDWPGERGNFLARWMTRSVCLSKLTKLKVCASYTTEVNVSECNFTSKTVC
jgi:hypothetical protein